jgi:MFS family permease
MQVLPLRRENQSDSEIQSDLSLLRRNVRISLAEGAGYSLMVGLGETYIPAFVIAVGLGEVNAGLITTLPLLAGALFQLISPAMVSQLGSYRKWVVLCATVQCLSFLPLVLASLWGYLPASAAFTIAAVYWGTNLSLSACWSSWLGALIPGCCRTNFFAGRARLTQAGAMIGFLLGGLFLQWHEGATRWRFAAVFFLAFLFRAGSVYGLSRQSEVETPKPTRNATVPLSEILRCFGKDEPAGRLLIYLLSVQLAVQISSPFVTPYLLKGLNFGYWDFALLTAASYASKCLVLPWFGRRARTTGTQPLLWLGGVGITTLPFLWILSTSFWYLIAVQILNGFFWGAYELASTLLILDKVPSRERISVLTKYNVANAVVMVVGSLVGAMILDVSGEKLIGYYSLFTISTIGRASTLLLLARLVIIRPKWNDFHLPSLHIAPFHGFITPIQGWTRLFRLRRIKETLEREDSP